MNNYITHGLIHCLLPWSIFNKGPRRIRENSPRTASAVWFSTVLDYIGYISSYHDYYNRYVEIYKTKDDLGYEWCIYKFVMVHFGLISARCSIDWKSPTFSAPTILLLKELRELFYWIYEESVSCIRVEVETIFCA